MNPQIGFMQGRLSELVDGKIQAFPRDNWEQEFNSANKLSLRLMEWTLDHDGLSENPLMTPSGQERIRSLKQIYNLSIPSLTGDCFMQAPFWKAEGDLRIALEQEFLSVVQACAAVGINLIVVPLVDNGAITNSQQEESLIEFFTRHIELLNDLQIKISFESDLDADPLFLFINKLDRNVFGINYDIGNSAALGFDPTIELSRYGSFITNVHIKDRVFGGTTVPLGEGDADFVTVFSLLAKYKYSGNMIMQTARDQDENHIGIMKTYMSQVTKWLAQASA